MITFKDGIFAWRGTYEDRSVPYEAGFTWHPGWKIWYTKSLYFAYNLIHEADRSARQALLPLATKIMYSGLEDSAHGLFSPPGDNEYMEFQKAGIWAACRRLDDHRAAGIFDDPGLGKTIQAIGVLNVKGYRKVLVICPAFLRQNWHTEMEKWWTNFDDPAIIRSGKDEVGKRSVICSYNLAAGIRRRDFDCIIIDELHRLKNPKAKWVQKILIEDNSLFNASGAKIIALTGTPVPNGKPEEVWLMVKYLAPEVTEDFLQDEWHFKNRFCVFDSDEYGTFVVGSKNLNELHNRLRGSGFMVRRRKADVLKELPAKLHAMVVLDPNAKTLKLLKKEAEFSVEEILEQGGVCRHGGHAELRRLLGISKIEDAANFVMEMLMNGTQKIVVGAYHVDVVKGLTDEISRRAVKTLQVLEIYGAVKESDRVDRIQDFQTTSEPAVIIGQIQAMGEGVTLTAASDCVMVEESWIPGQNDQFSDRLHRIGQNEKVTVWHLMYKDSIDSKVFSRTTEKKLDMTKIVG